MGTNRRKLVASYYRRLRMKSVPATLGAMLDPRRLGAHVRNIVAGEVRERSNPYRRTFSRPDEARFCADILDCPPADVEAAFDELDADEAFLRDLRERYARLRPEWPDGLDPGRFRMWYAIVRLRRPEVVVETGVHDGLSSALILRALDRNERGELVSIDLPSIDLPAGAPGWLVPDALRSRWSLRLGDARRLLPEVAERYARVDVFIHDSDHAREHREFEFRTMKPVLSAAEGQAAAPAGILLSDDDADDLLDVLAAEWPAARFGVLCTLPDDDTARIGGLRL